MNALHLLPIDILFTIMKFIEYNNHFLNYIKYYNKEKYIDIIKSINNQINYKYNILKCLDNIYINIHKIQTKVEYIDNKNKLFMANTYSKVNINIIAYKLLELYEGKLDTKFKKKFNNLCIILKHPYIKYCIDNIKKFDTKINTNYLSLDLDTYILIKTDLFL